MIWRLGKFFTISENPVSGAISGGIYAREYGLYRLLSKRFFYAIYYEIKNNIAYVIAIFSLRRDPARLEENIREENSKHEGGIIQRFVC